MRCIICCQKIFHKRGLKIRLCNCCTKGLHPLFISYKKIIGYKPLKVTSLFSLSETCKKIIYEYKFNKKIYYAETISSLFAESINLTVNPDIICTVPSHFYDETKRGYSHMNYIADLLSRKLDIKYFPILKKKLFPFFKRNQKVKNKKQRDIYLNNYYISNKAVNIKGKKIILIDDVLTTGNTVYNCSKLLYEKGADKIEAVTLALTEF